MNLSGKRVLITRARSQADELAMAFAANGAQPIFFPVIEIVPPDDFRALDSAIQSLDQFDWLIFTSLNALEAFLGRLHFLGKERIPLSLRVAAVGAKTARAISKRGLGIDYVPDEYLSDAMVSGFGDNLHGKRFLLPQSNLARIALADGIRSAGGLVTEVVAYRTTACEPDREHFEQLRSGVDIVTFASPSAVHNFVTVVQKNGLDPHSLPGNPLFACIGPVTESAAKEVGLSNLIAAKEHTVDGLLSALQNPEVL